MPRTRDAAVECDTAGVWIFRSMGRTVTRDSARVCLWVVVGVPPPGPRWLAARLCERCCAWLRSALCEPARV